MVDFIICKIENGFYAFKLDNIQRIVETQKLTPISDNSIYIDGIMTYENKPIEVINLKKVLNFTEAQENITSKKILIYKKDEKTVGLIVDTIENIVHLNENETEFLKAETKPNSILSMSEVVEVDKKLICIVNSVNLDLLNVL